MRKTWTLLLCLLCLACLPGIAGHAETLSVDGIKYLIENGEARMTGYVPDAETVVYRRTVNGYPVPVEEYIWQLGQSSAKTLVIEEGITEIPDGYFCNWEALETIVWPTTLTRLGQGTFSSCSAIRSVEIPEGVVSVNGTFSMCDKMETVSLPASLKTSDWLGFTGESLQEINVAAGSTDYRSVDGVLYSKDGKRLVLYPSGRQGPFTIPAGVTEITQSAFGWNSKLEALTIPEGVTSLESTLLQSCMEMKTVNLPASLTTIEDMALPGYGVLSRIDMADGNPKYYSVDGVLFDRRTKEIVHFPPAWGTSYDVPEGTPSIGSEIFAYNRMLETITIPRSVTEIADGAFSGCGWLRSVALPITLEKIGSYAFSECIALSSITLPPGLLSIGELAFYYCTSLKQIIVPDSVTEMASTAFTVSSNGEDVVLYARKDSAAYRCAWINNMLWAEKPGETPVRPVDLERAPKAAVVNNDDANTNLNLREDPSESAKIISQYPNGTTAEVLGSEGNWLKVRVGGTEGYMTKNRTVETDSLTHAVRVIWGRVKDDLAGPALLYSQPLDSAPSVSIAKGTTFFVLDTYGVWYKAEVDGQIGYILSQQARVAGNISWEMPDYGVIVNPNQRDRLHLRESPSTRSTSLGRYFNGTQVEILEWVNEWVRVRVDGKEGYMLSEYVAGIGKWEGTLEPGNG